MKGAVLKDESRRRGRRLVRCGALFFVLISSGLNRDLASSYAKDPPAASEEEKRRGIREALVLGISFSLPADVSLSIVQHS